LTEELSTLTENNSSTNQENADLQKFIAAKTKEIKKIIQRIEISSLLKEVDIEEMAQLSTS